MSHFDRRFNTLRFPSVASIGTTATKVFSLGNRRVFQIVNTHATQDLAIGVSNAVDETDSTTYAALLEAGEVLEIIGYTGEVWAKATDAATTFQGFEGYDVTT